MNSTLQVPDVLKKILSRKLDEITERREKTPVAVLEEKAANRTDRRGFTRAIEAKISLGQPAVIAEIKKASPSRGVIRENFDPVAIAQSYERGGAACLSVLTDTDFFQGADCHLSMARSATKLPVLRKDFIIDEYQVYESAALGADCILLIAAALKPDKLKALLNTAEKLGLDALIEVHNRVELDTALQLDTRLIGINNRDLRTFYTSLETTFSLLDGIPSDRIVVTESGIHTIDDVAAMRGHNVNAFLVGETFMRAEDPGYKLMEMFN